MKTVRLVVALALLYALIVWAAPVALAETGGDIETLYQQALHKQEGEGDAEAAAELYKTVIAEGEKTESIVLAARMKLADIFEKQGRTDDALALYGLVMEKAPGSPEAARAGERLRAMGFDTVNRPERGIEVRLARRLPEVVVPRMQFLDFLNYLRSAGDINIVLDASLSGAAGESDWAVKDLALKDVSVADVLNLVTRGFELDWTVWSGAVYISSADKIQALKQHAESTAAPSAELTLLARKIALLEEQLQGMQKLYKAGMLGGDDVRKAELDLISAKLERETLLRQLGQSKDVGKTDSMSQPPDDRPQTGARVTSDTNPTRVVLLDVDKANGSIAQVLNLETGEAIAVDRKASSAAFFANHPGFNLFYDRQLLLVGDGVKAALLPEGTTLSNVPADIAFAYKAASGGPSSIKEPGVYAANQEDLSFLVIEPDARPVYIETKKGAWLLTDISREGDSVSFNVTRLR